jgi:hypothetical protein
MKFVLSILLATTSTVLAETTRTVQDGIAVEVTVEPTTITVGDTVTLRIDAVAPDQIQLALSEEEAFGSFVITEATSLLDIPSDTGRIWTWAMQLDTFDASATELDNVEIIWTDSNGNTGTIAVPSVPMHITSVAGSDLETMNLRQIKGSVPLLSTIGWWPVYLGGTALLCVGIIYILLGRARTKPTLSPKGEALLALTRLQQDTVEVQEFYTRLSAIVRSYIEAEFNITATGQTTREFLIAEKENPRLEHNDRTSLSDFLVAADLVKFAQLEPKKQNWDHALQKATAFVSNTIVLHTEAEVAA